MSLSGFQFARLIEGCLVVPDLLAIVDLQNGGRTVAEAGLFHHGHTHDSGGFAIGAVSVGLSVHGVERDEAILIISHSMSPV